MPTRDEAIAKVVKVLRLARGAGTGHEAHAALLTAQRLMYAHGIEEHEVVEGPAPGKEPILETLVERSPRRLPWNEYLAAVVAENFRCAYLISQSRSTGAVSLIFIGRRSDAAVAAEAYRSAAAAGASLAEAFALTKAPADREAARDSYRIGFLQGLYERFQANTSECALLVLQEPEVAAHAAALANGGAATGAPIAAPDADAVRQGYASGYQYGSGEKPLED